MPLKEPKEIRAVVIQCSRALDRASQCCNSALHDYEYERDLESDPDYDRTLQKLREALAVSWSAADRIRQVIESVEDLRRSE